jgi:glycosyltransferase involved in cell wall biosynthesis
MQPTDFKVSVICPCSRPEDLYHIIAQFARQDYKNKELIIVGHSAHAFNKPEDGIFYINEDKDRTIGARRNIAAWTATGSIIVHMDSDDFYSPVWITKSVRALCDSGKQVVGLSRAYFYQAQSNKLYLFESEEGAQLYICGATLCYWRTWWEANPFQDIQPGEDTIFITNAPRAAHKGTRHFMAHIHGRNTESHKAIPAMKHVPHAEAAPIIAYHIGINL